MTSGILSLDYTLNYSYPRPLLWWSNLFFIILWCCRQHYHNPLRPSSLLKSMDCMQKYLALRKLFKIQNLFISTFITMILYENFWKNLWKKSIFYPKKLQVEALNNWLLLFFFPNIYLQSDLWHVCFASSIDRILCNFRVCKLMPSLRLFQMKNKGAIKEGTPALFI